MLACLAAKVDHTSFDASPISSGALTSASHKREALGFWLYSNLRWPPEVHVKERERTDIHADPLPLDMPTRENGMMVPLQTEWNEQHAVRRLVAW